MRNTYWLTAAYRLETGVPEGSPSPINTVDCYHYPYELLSGVTGRSIGFVPTFQPPRGAPKP